MYRVELKAGFCKNFPSCMFNTFLMYRVELKGESAQVLFTHKINKVPNAPCGVEKELSETA
jgi:hypothetical protein